jgi:hypothetical protein
LFTLFAIVMVCVAIAFIAAVQGGVCENPLCI